MDLSIIPPQRIFSACPGFLDITEPLVLACIDESKPTSPLRYEDRDGCGEFSPHAYALMNREAVAMVLPFLKDANGNPQMNPELL